MERAGSSIKRGDAVDLKSRGVDHLMLWFMDAPDTDGMAYFMQEIAPSFR
jgi:hypothetical protein